MPACAGLTVVGFGTRAFHSTVILAEARIHPFSSWRARAVMRHLAWKPAFAGLTVVGFGTGAFHSTVILAEARIHAALL